MAAMATLSSFGVHVSASAESMRRGQPENFFDSQITKLQIGLTAPQPTASASLQTLTDTGALASQLHAILVSEFQIDASINASLMACGLNSAKMIRYVEAIGAALGLQLPPSTLSTRARCAKTTNAHTSGLVSHSAPHQLWYLNAAPFAALPSASQAPTARVYLWRAALPQGPLKSSCDQASVASQVAQQGRPSRSWRRLVVTRSMLSRLCGGQLATRHRQEGEHQSVCICCAKPPAFERAPRRFLATGMAASSRMRTGLGTRCLAPPPPRRRRWTRSRSAKRHQTL